MRPAQTPIGLQLASAARAVSRAFDAALAEAGGSLPVWLVLLNAKSGQAASQRRLADAIGVREATLTHHLNAMEAEGLIIRHRQPLNRRVQSVALTDAGEAAFAALLSAAVAFDRRLRAGLDDDDVARLSALLDRMVANVGAPAPGPAGGSGRHSASPSGDRDTAACERREMP